MIFINPGNHFEAFPLLKEAQLSAGFHVGVADFDNDGNEDIFLARITLLFLRINAGRGLIMMETGGNFTSLNGTESGIKIYGKQRGAAVSDRAIGLRTVTPR